jgi:hypothetical protein
VHKNADKQKKDDENEYEDKNVIANLKKRDKCQALKRREEINVKPLYAMGGQERIRTY